MSNHSSEGGLKTIYKYLLQNNLQSIIMYPIIYLFFFHNNIFYTNYTNAAFIYKYKYIVYWIKYYANEYNIVKFTFDTMCLYIKARAHDDRAFGGI